MGASKPMLPFGDQTVLARVAAAFKEGGVQRVMVVGRTDDADLAREALELGLRYVFNLEPERGMAGSILEALDDCRSEWLALCPADIPMLRPETIAACLTALTEGRNVVQPECGGRRRHPVFLRAGLFLDLRTSLGEGGTLRQFLRGREIRHVAVEGCAQFQDINTPEEYARLLADAGLGPN